MSDFDGRVERLETALQDIETSMSNTEVVSSAFRNEIESPVVLPLW